MQKIYHSKRCNLLCRESDTKYCMYFLHLCYVYSNVVVELLDNILLFFKQVFFYSTLIFRSAGLNIQESQGASIGAGVINCIMALAAAPLIK